MKAVSSSIIVLAGAVMITGGAFIQHNDTEMFMMLVGGAVGAVGLWQWFRSMQLDDQP